MGDVANRFDGRVFVGASNILPEKQFLSSVAAVARAFLAQY